MNGLYDGFNRKVDYLRISITDRCNLRCFYCMPESGVVPKPHKEILSYEEIELFVRAAAEAGISKVRITGGEPLVRRDAAKLIEMISKVPGLTDISLTTNGILLPEYGDDLKKAGLRRVNISIDSLDPEVYRRITRHGDVKRALSGLRKAIELGFEPVKINTVLMRGVNDDPRAFIRLIYDYPIHIRFIELMPISRWDPNLFISVDEFKTKLATFGPLELVAGPQGAGPASYVIFKGALGTIGFISPMSNHFCSSCNRLRLTPDGKLRACLFSDVEFDIKPKLRDNIHGEEIITLVRNVLKNKPEKHDARKGETLERLMCQIGG
ncbi:MAG: GTP 3',8-cyclase MoaA [Actinomycetota bacterium]|nr:GTP 3',8-cyclase MoaA [Actinomycetota bacterium]